MVVHNRQNCTKWVRILVAPLLTASFLDVEKGTGAHSPHTWSSTALSRFQTNAWQKVIWYRSKVHVEKGLVVHERAKFRSSKKQSSYGKSEKSLPVQKIQWIFTNLIIYYSIHKIYSLGLTSSKKNLPHVFSPYSLTKNLPLYSYECQQRVSKYFIFRIADKHLVFIVDFVLMLANCLTSFIQIIHGKENKTGSSR